MNTKQLLKRLEAAKKEIERALESLSEVTEAEATQQFAGRHCPACERPLTPGEKIIRGLCQKCYNKLSAIARKQDQTIDDLLGEGVLPPPKKGGRPSLQAERVISEVAGRLDDRRDKK